MPENVLTELETELVGPPANPKLRQIGEHVLTEFSAAAVKALAHEADPQTFPLGATNLLEQQFAARFAAKPATARAAAAKRAAVIAANPIAYQRIAGLNLVNFKVLTPVVEQLAPKQPAVAITPDELLHAVDLPTQPSQMKWLGLEVDAEDLAEAGLMPAGASAERIKLNPELLEKTKLNQELLEKIKVDPELLKKPVAQLHFTPYDGVELRLGKMRCVEETDGPGSDEISLAAIAISANGTMKKIDTFRVSNDFDSGEVVKFGPKVFVRFPYPADDKVSYKGKELNVGWPRKYHVTLLLAEIDNGGFPEFVNDIFNRLKDKVVTAVAAAVGAAIGATALSEIPGLGTAIGAAVGALVGWILGELWGAIKDWWEDDEFVPLTISVKRKTQISRFKNESADDSKNGIVWWKGMGAYYRMSFDWKVYGGLASPS